MIKAPLKLSGILGGGKFLCHLQRWLYLYLHLPGVESSFPSLARTFLFREGMCRVPYIPWCSHFLFDPSQPPEWLGDGRCWIERYDAWYGVWFFFAWISKLETIKHRPLQDDRSLARWSFWDLGSLLPGFCTLAFTASSPTLTAQELEGRWVQPRDEWRSTARSNRQLPLTAGRTHPAMSEALSLMTPELQLQQLQALQQQVLCLAQTLAAKCTCCFFASVYNTDFCDLERVLPCECTDLA